MNNILISGITGFVGSNLERFLASSNEITGVSRESNKNLNIISYNELSSDNFSKSEAFVHLAGKAHDLRKGIFDDEYYKANTELTIKLFNLFLKSDCNIFVFMSSVKAAADKVETVLTEDIISKPITAYGKSKLKAEEYILSKKIPESKKVYILRPCMIHGPNNKGNLNLLYKLIINNIPYPLGKFKNNRSFLSVENLCFVIDTLIKKKPDSGIYNVSDDEPISTNKLVKIIGKATNKRVFILNIPKSIINVMAFLGDKTGILLNTENLHKLTENYCVSNDKIKKAIKEDLPLNSLDGLNITIMSFKEKNV